MIEVFNIAETFSTWSVPFMPISIALLLVFFLLFMISAALKTFDGIQLERKVFHLVIAAVLITLWPVLIINIKGLVDSFNTFLIQNVFQLQWEAGMGRPVGQQLMAALDLGFDFWNYPIKFVNFLLALGVAASYQIIYWLFVLFFFLYAALGPLVISRSIFGEELEAVIELLKDLTTLFLWQSTYIIIVGLLDTGYASSSRFILEDDNFFLAGSKAIALIVLTLCVPLVTRKFVGEIGSTHGSGNQLSGAYGFALGAAVTSRPHLLPPILTAAGLRYEIVKVAAKTFLRKNTESHEEKKMKRDPAGNRALEAKLSEQSKTLEPPEHPQPSSNGQLVSEHAEKDVHQEEYEYSHETTVRRNSAVEENSSDSPENLARMPAAKSKVKQQKTGVFDILFPSRKGETTLAGYDKIQALRRQIILTRGPINSDKYNDLSRMGLNHEDYNSSDLKTLNKYARSLNRFHRQYAWLYDFEGTFIGPDHLRPQGRDLR